MWEIITTTQMYRRIVTIVLTLLVALSVDAKMYGLFYGIDCDGLECPENDVTDLAELYRKNGGQVILVRGNGVTRNNVLDGLKKQAAVCTPNDIIMFVYSGHGNDGYIQCGNQYVNFSEIKSILSGCKARRKVVIIDACYSGSFTNQKHGKLLGENVIVLTSSRNNEESYETEGDRNSHLFTALIDGLKGKADTNKDGMVVAKELHNYLKNNTDKFLHMQHPTMKGRFNENTILYTYKRNEPQKPIPPKPIEADSKPTTTLPGVAPITTQVDENEASVGGLTVGYLREIWNWFSWWKFIGIVVLFAVVVMIFKYFIAYKLLMKYL